MEVHPHTQTERKKWHHYFWEFFMLFLAVTLGFFVENQREQWGERKREKQYMRSMIADLKADTLEYADAIRFNTKKMAGLDSMLDKLNDVSLNPTALYYFMRKYALPSSWRVHPSQRTISQLRNAGGMRLIHQQDVSDSINKYDGLINGLLSQEEAVVSYGRTVRDMIWEVFDLNSIRPLKYEDAEKILQTGLHLQLMTNDSKIIKELSNRIFSLQLVIKVENRLLNDRRADAERLILYIREKYSFE
jgi:hypothetical protein